MDRRAKHSGPDSGPDSGHDSGHDGAKDTVHGSVQARPLPPEGMHAVLAFSAVPLFLGALLSDWAYAQSHEIQWANFAAWLNAGGLVVGGLALVWAVVAVLGSRAAGHRRSVVYLMLLLASFAIGFVNALIHAKDGWAAMPAGLALSAAVLLLAAAASVTGLAALHRRVA